MDSDLTPCFGQLNFSPSLCADSTEITFRDFRTTSPHTDLVIRCCPFIIWYFQDSTFSKTKLTNSEIAHNHSKVTLSDNGEFVELVHLGCPMTGHWSFTDAATIWKPLAEIFNSFSCLFDQIGLRKKWIKPAFSGTCFDLRCLMQPLFRFMLLLVCLCQSTCWNHGWPSMTFNDPQWPSTTSNTEEEIVTSGALIYLYHHFTVPLVLQFPFLVM